MTAIATPDPTAHPRPASRWFGVAALAFSVALLVGLAIFCIDMLSAARAYVGGESLWTKGQKEAVQHLTRYAETRAAQDWDAYRAAIAIPLGDRVAREELDRPQPDYRRVREGFLAGGNHPDDIAAMIRLYRWFGRVPFVDRAIAAWARADVLIGELVTAAEALRAAVDSDADAAALHQPLERIRAIDSRLRPLEVEFSASLGEATRVTRAVSTAALLAVGLLLLVAGGAVARGLARRRELYEAALRSSEERFRRAVEGSRDGIWEWIVHSGAMFYSPRCEELAGVAPGVLPRRHRQVVDRLHPDDVERVRLATGAHFASGAPYDVEFRMRSDAGWRWVRSRGQAVVDPDTGELRMSGSLSDVHARRMAEEALRESEIRYRTLWETTSDTVLIVDEHNRICFANPAVQRMLGHDPAGLVGVPMTVLQPPRLQAAHAAGMQRYLAHGERRVDWRGVEVLALHRDGREVPVEVAFGEMTVAGTRYFVGFLRDISRRKEAEAALREANEGLERRVAERTADLTRANARLQELDRLKSEFLATMSHELRTPLNAILGFSSLLKHAQPPLPATQRQQAAMIESAGEHLLALINDVLDVSAIESGRLSVERVPFDLVPVVHGAVEQLRPLAERKGLRLSAALPFDRLVLHGDHRRTAQVLLNLVGNAIKFTAAGDIQVSARLADTQVEVAVRDTGIGIAPHDLTTLFEAFRQVDGSAARAHEGTGLGLYLTRKLLGLMDGTIDVASRPGAGSTFRFTLPLVPGGATAAAAIEALSAGRSA